MLEKRYVMVEMECDYHNVLERSFYAFPAYYDDEMICNEGGLMDEFDSFCEAYRPEDLHTDREIDDYYDGCRYYIYNITRDQYEERMQ